MWSTSACASGNGLGGTGGRQRCSGGSSKGRAAAHRGHPRPVGGSRAAAWRAGVGRGRSHARACQEDANELARKTQNPIADLISLPLQNDLNFGYGANDAPEPSSTRYVPNIQPVVPIEVAKGLNLITRPISR